MTPGNPATAVLLHTSFYVELTAYSATPQLTVCVCGGVGMVSVGRVLGNTIFDFALTPFVLQTLQRDLKAFAQTFLP